ncbi:2OG-Fe(II) oxygenase family protein [Lentzea sp. NPDC054927]
MTLPLVHLEASAAEFAETALTGAATFGAFELAGAAETRRVADHADRIATEFFALPQEKKLGSQSPSGHKNRGWTFSDDDNGRRVFDRYSVARFDDVAAARAGGVRPEYLDLYEHANVWPDVHVQTVFEEYRASVVGTFERLLGRLAEAFSVDVSAFVGPGPDNTNVTFTLYQPRPGADGLSFPEHRDRSSISALTESGEADRLEIRAPDGSWLPCRTAPGNLLMLFGLTASQRTGGKIEAAQHRVIPPTGALRSSTAAFYFPDLDTPATPLFGESDERRTVGQVLLDARGRSL